MIIRLIGHRFRFHHDPERNASIEIFDRQVRAFGMEIQQVLRTAGSRSVFGLEFNAEFRESLTGRASTALSPLVTIGLCISSGCSAMTRTSLFVAQVPPIYKSSICLLVLP